MTTDWPPRFPFGSSNNARQGYLSFHDWRTPASSAETNCSGCQIVVVRLSRIEDYLVDNIYTHMLSRMINGVQPESDQAAELIPNWDTPGRPETQSPQVWRSRKGLQRPRLLAKNARRAGHPLYCAEGKHGPACGSLTSQSKRVIVWLLKNSFSQNSQR